MSANSRIRSSVSKDLMEKEFVTTEEKTRCLATAIYACTRNSPFLGSVLQCLNISYAHTLQTAGIMFNTDAKRWDMLVNPYFFCKKLNDEQRKAVLVHELNHITHKHPLRVPFLKISARKRILMNIGADMAINQFIKGLPSGCPQCPPVHVAAPCANELCPGRCIDVKDYYDEDDKGNKLPWEANRTMEHYYEKLLTKFREPDDEDGEGEGEGEEGDGQDQKDGKGKGKGKGKDGKGKGNAGGGADHGDLPNTIDEHLWDGASDEKDMLEATEDLVKRAMVKARLSYDDLPGHVKELLEEIKARRAELNYKALILSAMKRHASGHDRKHTWMRKSKRFGYKAPGTKVGELPKLHNYLDTSGSISIEEANEFLDIVDQFLKVGARKCRINLFHTANYYSEEYKMGQRIRREDIQSGGTDLTESFRDIWKRKPDLAVFLTDGCYGDIDVESWMKPGERFPQVLFIISKGGSENHPLRRFGETVKVPDTSRKK